MNDPGGKSCSSEPLNKELVGTESPTHPVEAAMANAASNNDTHTDDGAAPAGGPPTAENMMMDVDLAPETEDSNTMDSISSSNDAMSEESLHVADIMDTEEVLVPEQPLPVPMEAPIVAEPLVPILFIEPLLPPQIFGLEPLGVAQPFVAPQPLLPPEPFIPPGAFINISPFGQPEPFVPQGAFVPPEAFVLPEGFLSPASIIRPESPIPWRGPSLHNPFSVFSPLVEFDHDGYVVTPQSVSPSNPPNGAAHFDAGEEYLSSSPEDHPGPINRFNDTFPMPNPLPVTRPLFPSEMIEPLLDVIPKKKAKKSHEEQVKDLLDENDDELMEDTPPPEETPEEKATSRKLKFSGICRLKDETLERLYNLHRLSDDDLATVGLTRKSLIDDYRHHHEMSMQREREEEKRRSQRQSRSRVPHSRSRPMRPLKTYKFQLLNQLVKVLSNEIDPLTIFREQQFEFDADYYEDEAVAMMPIKERERRRFESFCDHLDNMFICGDRNMAVDMVVDALIRLNRRRKQMALAAYQAANLS
ncbi:uncharacterized protein [Drosophila bipectinata]|uniref:uncharacterized protein isoform X2 n=1 Tax=Drosophila bipectinata TaxID=42026 RepID=UPI001C898AE5|nr:histone-lysine N-methyltransferase 2D isoform X2 [Drosophila bipectinata]